VITATFTGSGSMHDHKFNLPLSSYLHFKYFEYENSLQILKVLARLACIYLDGRQPSQAVPVDGEVQRWEGKLVDMIADGQSQAVSDAFWSLESFNGFAQVALSGACPTSAPCLSDPPPTLHAHLHCHHKPLTLS